MTPDETDDPVRAMDWPCYAAEQEAGSGDVQNLSLE